MHLRICGSQEEVLSSEATLRTWEQRRPRYPELQAKLLAAKETVATNAKQLRYFDYRNYMVRKHAERDSTGSLLAWLVNPTKRGSVIVELEDNRGYRAYWLNDYYAILCRLVRNVKMDIETFLAPLTLPMLSPDEAAELGVNITLQEVRAAIKTMARTRLLALMACRLSSILPTWIP
ncbi:hypothetical protein NDU88_001700 [Pleurodeles waltl]|uniref:Uncharacterized protein n=1 Tax=Pleurodeles waltl TaxID=8319 RepID=A0AAV7SAU0_PLEWA|nr:hypothetical protein NDU88_001700 [Pleurodeles waltl]